MKINVSVEDRSFLNALKGADASIVKEVELEIKKSLRDVQEDARKNHRFLNWPGTSGKSSGNLERSVQPQRVDNMTGEIKLDTGIAIYGPRIHEGFGAWKHDQFLFQALDRAKDKIKVNIRNGYIKGLRKVDLL